MLLTALSVRPSLRSGVSVGGVSGEQQRCLGL